MNRFIAPLAFLLMGASVNTSGSAADAASADPLAAEISAAGNRVAAQQILASGHDIDTPALAALDTEYRKTLYRARIKQAQFAIEATDYQIRAYHHHQFWTDAAAVMVYFLTGFGVLCSAVQFRLFSRIRGRGVDGTDAATDTHTAGMVEIPGGMKVSSPFLGVVILVISLGFFSLYLTAVYPIKVLESAPVRLEQP